MELLTQRYQDKIEGVLSCYDRIVIIGTLPTLCHAKGMTGYLFGNKIRIFDYARFVEPFGEQLRVHAQQLAKQNAVDIEFVRSPNVGKEDLVKKVLQKRGTHAGLVHILSAMEACPSYEPWHDKQTGKNFLKSRQGKCLHYYFYIMDSLLGLCYVRVPTWCPFRLQIYFNGHGWLAGQLDKAGIQYRLTDNAFEWISDWEEAQRIADAFSVESLHQRLDFFAKEFCPVHEQFKEHYHWSIMQPEYATDIVFKHAEYLQPIYGQIIKTAVHTVKPDHISTFLGQKLHGNYTGQAGNQYSVRIEGAKIKHVMRYASIKIYDKFGKILRIETTSTNISFFKHYPTVEHRNGEQETKMAPMKKNIYSLVPLAPIMQSCNRRYLEFISAIDDKSMGRKNLQKVTTPIQQSRRTFKGFNFFSPKDENILLCISRGEFNIQGLRNKNLQQLLNQSPSQISRILKRLHLHGLIRKVRNTYKYYLTKLGKKVVAAGQKIKECIIIPELSFNVMAA